MTDIENLIEIYDLLQDRNYSAASLEQLRQLMAKRFFQLYDKRKSDYDRRKSNALKEEIIKLLEWLMMNHPENKNAYEQLLSFFNTQTRREKRAKEGFPEIKEFKADRKSVVSGVEVQLSWVVVNAADITIVSKNNSTIVPEDDFLNVFPVTGEKTEVVQYKLVAANKSKSVEQTIEVIVHPVPYLKVINTPFPVIKLETDLALDLSMPDFDLPGGMDVLLKAVTFSPPDLYYLNDFDSVAPTKRSIFNLYNFYGYLRSRFRK
jgi:hypothetical protein